MGVWRHIIVTGQSNSTGSGDGPHLSGTTQFDNKMLDAGPGVLQPLSEPCTRFAYGAYDRETPASGILETLARLTDQSYSIGMFGVGGVGIDTLSKAFGAGGSYAACISELARVVTWAAGQGHTVEVPAIVMIHGENDANSDNANYAKQIALLQRDYDADIKLATGQSISPVMLCSSPAKRQAPGYLWMPRIAMIERQFAAAGDLNENVIYLGSLCGYMQGSDLDHHQNHGIRAFGAMFGRTIATIMKGTFRRPAFSARAVSSAQSVTVSFVEKVQGDLSAWEFFDGANSALSIRGSSKSADEKSITFSLSGTAKKWRYGNAQTGNLCTENGYYFPTLIGNC